MTTTPGSASESRVGWPAGVLVALVAFYLAYALRVALQTLDGVERAPLTAVYIPPLAAAVLLLSWRAARQPHLDTRLRAAWQRLTAAFALLAAGTVWELVNRGLDLPWGDLAHVLWFAYYPMLLLGFVALADPSGGDAERRRFWLDVGVVTTGGGMVLALLFASRMGEVYGTVDVLLPIGYLVGDLALLAGLAIVVLQVAVARTRGWLPWLAAAVIVEVAADVVYGVERMTDGSSLLGLEHVLYAGAWVLRGVAAVRVATVPGALPRTQAGSRRSIHPLPVAAILAGYTVLAWAFWQGLERIATPLIVAAGLLTLLVLARQASAADEIAKLRAERAVREGEERFRSLVQNSSDVLMVVSASGQIREATPSVERILGYPPEELDGAPLESLVIAEQVSKLRHFLTQVVLTPGTHALIELVLRHRDGSPVEVEPVAVNLLADRSVEGIVLTLRDIRERRRLEKRLTHMAFHDALTGLANRLFFAEQIAHARSRARRHGTRVAAVYVDLDDFKQVNDELGHAAGDQVLVEMARRITAFCRTTDTAARLGGDEFAVLLEDVRDLDHACDAAERLRTSLAAPVSAGGREVAVGASLGVAEMQADEDDEGLLRHADLAMYHAKEAGKGRVVRFEESLGRESPRRRREGELRRAIARGDFELHYQPVCRIADGRVVGAEALLRWRRGGEGYAMPGEFLEFAEETGLIEPIGAWVVDEACSFAAEWARRTNHRTSVGFNVSARQITDPRFADVVAAAVARHGGSARDLVVEVTESTAAGSREDLLASLLRLRETGVRVAIDDFGAGYSSLQRLQELPVEILKVDRSLVAALETGAPPAVMRATVELARSLGLVLVAEGVESVEQRDHLRMLGCVWGQGFLWGAGLPGEEFFERWVAPGAPPDAP